MNQTGKIETNDNSLLNQEEGTYLNIIFETTRKEFDFRNKKIGFITGPSGKTIDNKEEYFDMQYKHSVDKNVLCDNGKLYIFNAAQKAESGGYDAAIVYWCKFLFSADNVVKRLKKKCR